MKKIKILKWEDLHEQRSNGIELRVYGKVIAVCDDGLEIIVIYTQLPESLIINVLKMVGFEIEFNEPQKLSKAEWHQVRVFDSGWIARDLVYN